MGGKGGARPTVLVRQRHFLGNPGEGCAVDRKNGEEMPIM